MAQTASAHRAEHKNVSEMGTELMSARS